MSYQPVDPDTATSLLGEGIHTGLRKGTGDAPGAQEMWHLISDNSTGWSDALAWAVDGLHEMDYAVCHREPDPGELRWEYAIAYDGEPSMSGRPQRMSVGRFTDLAGAETALDIMQQRNARSSSPKPNLRIERRWVTDWEQI